MSTRGRRLPVDSPELNLVPLLDMVSLLIQLMLINAQFGAYAQIPSEVAAVRAPAPADTPDVSLSLEVAITTTGYDVTWRDAGPQSRSIACTGSGCAAPTAYDATTLGALGEELSRKFPDEHRVVVRPAADVPFEVIVGVMDALRGPVAAPGEPERALRFADVVLAEGR